MTLQRHQHTEIVSTHLMNSSQQLSMSAVFLSDNLAVVFRSIPVNRLQQIIEVLESDIVVRLVQYFVGYFKYFNIVNTGCSK